MAMRGFFGLCGVLLLVATVLSFLGHLHPAFDSLTVIRVQFVMLGLCFAALGLVTGARLGGSAGLIAAIVAGLGLEPVYRTAASVESVGLRAYQQNVLFLNEDWDQVVTAVNDRSPDFVTFQEISRRTERIISALSDDYPHRVVCRWKLGTAVAVLSRLPMTGESGCLGGKGLGWMQVETPSGPLTVASLHLGWPYPYGQAAQVTKVAEQLRQLPRPIYLAGDFNALPWSHAIAEISRAGDMDLAPGYRASFQDLPIWPPLAIDHVLVDTSIPMQVTIGPKAGSDHNALLVALDYGHAPPESNLAALSPGSPLRRQ